MDPTRTTPDVQQAKGSGIAGSEEKGPAHVVVEMLSQPRYLSGARELVYAVSKRLGFGETACGQISLAVDEALCNIIRHGYGKREDGRIWLRIWPVETNGAEPNGIRIVLEDEAKQIDPEKIKGRELEDVRPGGLGVYIIKQVMDSVKYEKREQLGMRLELVKTRSPKAEEQG